MLLQTYIALLLLALLSIVASLESPVDGRHRVAKSSPSNTDRGRQPGKQQRSPAKNPKRRSPALQKGRPQWNPSGQRSPNRNNNLEAVNPWDNPQNFYPQNVQGSGWDRFPFENVQQQTPINTDDSLTVYPWLRPSKYDPQYSQQQQYGQSAPDLFRQQIPNPGYSQVSGIPGNLRNNPIYVIYYPYPVASQLYQDVGMNQRSPYASNAFMCAPDNQLYKIRLPADLSKLKRSNPNISVRMVKNSKFGSAGGYMTPFEARQLCQSYLPTNGEAQFASLSSPGYVNNPWGMPQIPSPVGITGPGAANLYALNDVNAPTMYNQGYDYNGDVPYNNMYSDQDDPMSIEDEQNFPYSSNGEAEPQSTRTSKNTVIKDQIPLEQEKIKSQ